MPKPWTPKQRATIEGAQVAVYGHPMPGVWGDPGVRPLLLMTLVVAAWWETRLGEYDGGDGGLSWGPWQAHTTRGVGIGHDPSSLVIPSYSAPLMLDEMVKQDRLTGLLSRALDQGTARDFVATWNAEVERPGKHEGVRMSREDVGRARSLLVDDWWGGTAASSPARGWLPVPRAA